MVSQPFSFAYGPLTISARLAGNRWMYTVGKVEYEGPPQRADWDLATLRLLIRDDYKKKRDPLAPGRGLYRIQPGWVSMEPSESGQAWVKPGVCYEGQAEGRVVIIDPPQDAGPDARPARLLPASVYRVEVEDCG